MVTIITNSYLSLSLAAHAKKSVMEGWMKLQAGWSGATERTHCFSGVNEVG